MMTSSDAAAFVRSRLAELSGRLNQDEVDSVLTSLKAMMGRTLNPADAAAIIEAFVDNAMPIGAMLSFGSPAVAVHA